MGKSSYKNNTSIPPKQHVKKKTVNINWWFVTAITIVFLFITIFLFFYTNRIRSLKNSEIINLEPSNTVYEFINTSNYQEGLLITLTNEPTIPQLKCPGALHETRIYSQKDARVCTKSDRLIIRQSAGMDSEEILRIHSGSTVYILEGPICNDNYWWWKVKLYPGTSYGLKGQQGIWTTTSSIYGWAREGWDDIDPYFLCQP